MKEIRLGRSGLVTLVDDEDYDFLSQWCWSARKGTNRKTMYASRLEKVGSGVSAPIRMHRVILGAQPGQIVDHKNLNGLDNRRENLRLCTHAQNLWNVGGWSRHGYKGVRLLHGKWNARIHVNRVVHGLGSFETLEEAARAYDKAAVVLHGEFARLNLP